MGFFTRPTSSKPIAQHTSQISIIMFTSSSSSARRGVKAWLLLAAVVLVSLVAGISAASMPDDINVRKLQQFTAPPTTSGTNGTATSTVPPTPTPTPTTTDTTTTNTTDTATDETEEEEGTADESADASSSSSGDEAEASAYNQGSEDCIYGDHPTSLVDTAASVPEFSTLVAALNASGLVDALSDPSTKLTVFAPTNDAFATLFSDFNVTAEEVLANQKFLSDVLKYHVVGDVKAFADLTDGETLPTLLEGESLGVNTTTVSSPIYGAFGFPLGTQTSEAVTIIGGETSATIQQGNVWTCNAVIQVIDAVLVPQSAVVAAE